jgi:hypothetical protein
VVFELTGEPIVVSVCHCDDCQRASKELEALPGAPKILDATGGTAYVMHRRDRAVCQKGAGHLVDHTLEGEKETKRVVAGCCQTPMYLDFAPGHWQAWFRDRWPDPAPAIQMRVQTRFAPAGAVWPDRVKRSPTYPLGFIVRLLRSRIGYREPQARD